MILDDDDFWVVNENDLLDDDDLEVGVVNTDVIMVKDLTLNYDDKIKKLIHNELVCQINYDYKMGIVSNNVKVIVMIMSSIYCDSLNSNRNERKNPKKNL